ncbi:ATP-binding protein [Microbacterium sp. EYE_5]|uniref:ATP-binding protein n=1 Tax=unclassified Microbacterium TaxID=2609290 RepID=UPI00200600FB|nr:MULTISPECIES: ATP-binding protein [unclassified Microbacterium]MCK6081703.1 ATP-binding protein [Microbacterium sp. EYE_382]MCK6086973.1 ATP-binding protein [Microbacterium sp. EYE_384]MCK6123529.1 ATP-binding protein [Microbacterium sp. EYE_80]MCK6126438.1 ATP-binding protein [Microbacterium sp. EYE_79]MCK6142657.1 ATP-binding protein [Microbacterium sp. EYE_39]
MSAESAFREVVGRADLALIDAVHDALEGLWVDVPDVSDEDRLLFALAVSEVATNVVEHAAGDVRPTVSIRLAVDAGRLVAVMSDDAEPALIRLGEVEMPGSDAESGRGLALALAALDELRHEADDGNTWVLRRDRRATS